MQERLVLARPYAKALYEIAAKDRTIQTWGDYLGQLAAVVQSEPVRRLLGAPRCIREELSECLHQLAGRVTGEKGSRLLQLLAERNRLYLLPEIQRQYQRLVAANSGCLQAEVLTALPLDVAAVSALQNALERRFKSPVSVRWQLERGLIGGAIIRVADLEIDGSLRGALERLSREVIGKDAVPLNSRLSDSLRKPFVRFTESDCQHAR